MRLTLITPPAVEPVTLEEAKDAQRIETADDDAFADAALIAAVRHAETMTGRAFINQTWELKLDAFPVAGPGSPWAEVRVPLPPLQSVVSLKYVDGAGVEQTLAAGTDYAVYDAGAARAAGRVAPAFGKTWPAARAEPNAVRLRFVAGYGAGTGNVPNEIKSAILLLFGDLYRFREESAAGLTVATRNAVEALLMPFRVWSF